MHADSRITFGQWAGALAVAMALHLMLAIGLPATRAPFGDTIDRASAGARAGGPSRIRIALGRAPAPVPAPGPVAAAPAAATSAPAVPAAVTPTAARAETPVANAPAEPQEAPESSPASPQQTAAAGSASATTGPGGSSQGNVGPDDSGGHSGTRTDYFDALFGQVLSILDYPRRARLEEVEGSVVLLVSIDRSGRLETCEIAESSGSPLLDRHALRIVRRAAPFGPVPASFEDADLSFELPLAFELE